MQKTNTNKKQPYESFASLCDTKNKSELYDKIVKKTDSFKQENSDYINSVKPEDCDPLTSTEMDKVESGKTVLFLYCPDDFAFYLGIAFIETLTTYYNHEECCVIAPIPLNLKIKQCTFKNHLQSPESHFIKEKEWDIAQGKIEMLDLNSSERIESLNKIFATNRFLKLFRDQHTRIDNTDNNRNHCDFRSSLREKIAETNQHHSLREQKTKITQHNNIVKKVISKDTKKIAVVIVNNESIILSNDSLKTRLSNDIGHHNCDVIPVAFMTTDEKTDEKIQKYTNKNVNIFDLDNRDEFITPESFGNKAIQLY